MVQYATIQLNRMDWQQFADKSKREGIKEGKAEGLREGERNLLLKMLTHRFGPLAAAEEAKIAKLNVEQMEKLGEDLLDFKSREEFTDWLTKFSL